MNRIAGRMNLWIALVSLGLSLLFWWIALPTWMSTRDRPFTIPLTSKYLDTNRFYIVKDPRSITIHATVSDEQYDRLSSMARAEANLSAAQPGTHPYAVSLEPPDLLKIVDPSKLIATYTLEEMKSKKVAVTVEPAGKLSDPTEIVNSLIPDTTVVNVVGPADAVARVVSARATLRLDTLQGSEPVSATLEPVDDQDQLVENVHPQPEQVLVTPRFMIAPQQKKVFVEAVFGDGQVASGYAVKSYSIMPSSVNVIGSSQALSRIASVSTEPINLTNLSRTESFQVGIQPLKGGVTFSPSTVTVTVVIRAVDVNHLSPAGTPSTSGTGFPLNGSGTGR